MQEVVEDFAKNIHKTQQHAHPIAKIYLWTGNPESAKFYERVGYHNVITEYSPNEKLRGFKFVKYLQEVLIKKVAVVGGTHGNEVIFFLLIFCS